MKCNKRENKSSSQKKAHKNWRTETLLTCVISVFVVVWICLGLVPELSKCLVQLQSGIYSLKEGRWFVTAPICFLLLLSTIFYCRQIWQDKIIRFHCLVLVVAGLIVLYCCRNMSEPVGEFGVSDYRLFLTILLLCVFSVMFVKSIVVLCREFKHNTGSAKQDELKAENSSKCFSDDQPLSDQFPKQTENYANAIVERFLSMNMKEHSCALSITGQWGMGKTTFLNALKKQMKEHADVVEFNPWICKSPEQVTKNFFASLCHQLSLKYSTLYQPIKEYAKHLSSEVSLSYNGLSLKVPLKIKQKSLFEQKNELSEKFAKLQRPVIVFIDDMDRLEKTEIFEVLRLIRNTADLHNVGYIVAYDKEYVTSVFEENNIKNAAAYLEKIFPIEIHLPKVEDYLVWNAFRVEIEKQNDIHEEFTKQLFNKFESDDRELILKILTNYRRAKRFANLFMLNYSYLQQHYRNEVKILDLFWVELLHFYDNKTYVILANDPECMLYRYGRRLKIRSGIIVSEAQKNKNEHNLIDGKEVPIYEGSYSWKEETPKILTKIFGEKIKETNRSVCYSENYNKYFTISVSPLKLSISEMQQFLSGTEEPDRVIDRWFEEEKYISSIIHQFGFLEVGNLDKVQLDRYLCGLLCFNTRTILYQNDYVLSVKNILRKERYGQSATEAHDIVMKWFKEKISEKESPIEDICKVLNRFYEPKCYDETGHEEPSFSLVISNEDIEQLLILLMDTFLNNSPNLTALDLIARDGTLHKLFKNCCVTVKDARYYNDIWEYKQVAFASIISHFSKKVIKPTLRECEEALGKLFYEPAPCFRDNDPDEDAYWEWASERYDDNMKEYFGNSYENKLEEFKIKCFANDSDGKQVKESISKSKKKTCKDS